MKQISCINFITAIKKAKKCFICVLLCAFIISLSFSACAEQVSGIWAGGNEYLIQILQFNSDKTGCWTLTCPLYESILSLDGTWTSNGNNVIFTTSEGGTTHLIGNISVSFDKGQKKEFTFNGNILVDNNDNTQLVRLPPKSK